jgi:branched-chain amino acid transport system ATP-binding protein
MLPSGRTAPSGGRAVSDTSASSSASASSSTAASAASATAVVERPLLEIDHVSVRFGGVVAVDDVTMSVPTGEIRGVIGPNGAGKTTLFDIVTGVRQPTSGRVLLDGADVTTRSAVWRSRNGVRRTFQRQQPFGWLSVEDNIVAALDWRGGGGGIVADLVASPTRRRLDRARRERAHEVMERCGLQDIRHVPAGRLSIGRARMVELARAIAESPRLLLLDEPTSGLEEHEAQKLADIVRSLRAEGSCGVLLVEHDVAFVMALCDRITVLNLGEVIADGAPDTITSDPLVRSAYLG